MKISERPVIIKEFPQSCDGGTFRSFLLDLNREMAQMVRPAVVIDCSNAKRVDRQSLLLLLCCLEEAMKRNGDVRLAGIRRDASPVLKSTGVEHLIQSYATVAHAVDSYRCPTLACKTLVVRSTTDDAAENAA
jgi:anti-sigma B factor antagonist